MSAAELFGVYTARFPFLDADKDKIRPVIVISKPYGQHNIITVILVSSTSKKESVDITLHGWREAGLIKPSIARIHRITTLLQSDLTNYLGDLSTGDKHNLQHGLKKLLNLR